MLLPCRSLFFFQAEDGIRDYRVTGVQTCALPIFARALARARVGLGALTVDGQPTAVTQALVAADLHLAADRSEARRGGEEWRTERGRRDPSQHKYTQHARLRYH